MSQEWIQNFAATHQLMNEWRSATYLEILNRYFQNDEVKRLLCSMLGYTGSRASKNSALSVTAMSGYFFFGGYRVIGGSQRLADYLASYITEHNGTVLCRHPVDSILVKNNAVIGVKTNNQIFKAPIVVSNVNAKTLYLDLLDRTSLPTKFLQDINDLPLGRSAVQVLLGVSQVFPSYPTLINDMDHGIHIIISSHDDPSSAPLSSSSITLLQSAVTADFPNPSSLEYDSKVAVLLNEMIEKADFSLPGLKDHLVIKKTFTPHDFEKLTAIPNGAIYCFDQSQVPIRPYFKAPIQGLYLANASSSGGGVEAVVIGGITCKHDITGWKRKIR